MIDTVRTWTRAVGRNQPASGFVTCAVVLTVGLAGCNGQISGANHSGVGPSTGAAGATSSTTGAGGSTTSALHPCVPGVINVGDSPMQRLTRDQYANSVRALLGLTTVSTDNITPDEKLGTFASNVSAGVTDLVIDEYTTMAEAAAKDAMTQAKWDVIVPCDHTAMGDGGCAANFIHAMGQRAYRRPLSAAEVGRYMIEYNTFAPNGYNDGIRVVVQTMLQSPNFLYRPELGGAPAGGVAALTPFELASRLSFFLWNSTPDDQLLSAAASSKLSSDDDLRTQGQRMLSDPRARDTIASFHLQWLDVETAATITKDPATYPAYSNAVGAAMEQETVDFAYDVLLQGDGKLQTLLTAPFTIAGDALLPIYGVSRPAGAAAQDHLPLDPGQRAGILTQASFLAVHAHPDQSAPVKRGKIVRQNVMCEPIPDPPPNVNTAPPAPSPNATTRQRFATHESVASCAACHTLIDKIGFGLENFDGLGQYRTMDGTQPVDASGEFVATEDLNGPFNGAIDLASKLAGSAEVHACVTSQWLSYALGRAQTSDDACSQSQLVTAFNTSGQNVKQLLVDILTSDSFRYRRASAGGKP